ncbi:MAG: Sec-independent protein translocase subunit TatA/TatB [Gaiella sp.]
MPFGIGMWEIIILVGVVLLIVGPAKAPSVARSLGRGVRDVRETVDGTQREVREAITGPADDTKS